MADERSGVVGVPSRFASEAVSLDGAAPSDDGRFRLSVVPNGTACVVVVSGEVDVATGPELRTALSTALDGARRVIVDISAVGFMDSTGLNAVVRARQKANGCGAELVVRGAAPQLVRLFEISGIEGLLESGPSGEPSVASPADAPGTPA
jgi:anti-anti-sigma factor